MAPGNRLRGRIEDMGPWQEGARAAAVREGSFEVQCSLTAADALGVAVEELVLRAITPAALTVEQVTAWAEEICRRVTSLREPLRLLEVDAVDAVALVRSAHPRARGAERSYYELIIRSDRSLSLRRLSTGVPARRAEAVPFTLTSEQLADLVKDLFAAHPER